MPKKITVELKLGNWSTQFLGALTRLIAAVEDADQALLEDEIRDAYLELREVLQRDGISK